MHHAASAFWRRFRSLNLFALFIFESSTRAPSLARMVNSFHFLPPPPESRPPPQLINNVSCLICGCNKTASPRAKGCDSIASATRCHRELNSVLNENIQDASVRSNVCSSLSTINLSSRSHVTHVLFQHLCFNQTDFHAAAAVSDCSKSYRVNSSFFFLIIPSSLRKLREEKFRTWMVVIGPAGFNQPTGGRTRCHGFPVEVSESKSFSGCVCSK